MKRHLYRFFLPVLLAVAGLFAAPIAMAKWSAAHVADRMTRDGGAQGAASAKSVVEQTYQRQLAHIGFGNSASLRKESHGYRQSGADEGRVGLIGLAT